MALVSQRRPVIHSAKAASITNFSRSLIAAYAELQAAAELLGALVQAETKTGQELSLAGSFLYVGELRRRSRGWSVGACSGGEPSGSATSSRPTDYRKRSGTPGFLAAPPFQRIILISHHSDTSFDLALTDGHLLTKSMTEFYRAALNAGRSSYQKAVCLSNAWIVRKRKNNLSRFFYHMRDHLA